MQIVPWQPKYEKQALCLLNRYRETSVFLLTNLKHYGTRLTDAVFSGDFKCIINHDKVVGVLSFTRAGTILLQTDRAADYSEIIVNECRTNIQWLKGVIADWKLADSLWTAFEKNFPKLQIEKRGKGILYQHDLTTHMPTQTNSNIRFLEEKDFVAWNKLNREFMQETFIPLENDIGAVKTRYLKAIAEKEWLGGFAHGQLVSICAVTTNLDDIAYAGNVYTIKEYRSKGYGKMLLQQILWHCKQIKMKKLLTVTSESNFPAKQLFAVVGFKSIGLMGLIFTE